MIKPTEVREKQENALLNLLFNIILPVVVLNQLSKRLGEDGPVIALIVALALPIGYGAYDYITRRKHNFISALGIVNVAFTGGFALLKLEGIWFAVKEAIFPLIIGMAVYVSNLAGKPLMKTLFWNDNIIQTQVIEEKLKSLNKEGELKKLFRKSTFLFSVSFFLSAFLNFVLAASIFTSIDPALPEAVKSEILNGQIAKMTWQGYVVIALPMMVFMGFVMWFTIHQLKKISGMTLEEILPSQKT